ncbi:MAG: hypothetical protein NC489_29655 [Ruminococcus flavefaciens]|nr:hypothetical protein [Ruminococcus flavefaciens]
MDIKKDNRYCIDFGKGWGNFILKYIGNTLKSMAATDQMLVGKVVSVADKEATVDVTFRIFLPKEILVREYKEEEGIDKEREVK